MDWIKELANEIVQRFSEHDVTFEEFEQTLLQLNKEIRAEVLIRWEKTWKKHGKGVANK